MVSIFPLVLGVSLVSPRGLPEPFLLGGIQINEPEHDVWVEALRAGGFDTCEVTVYARQADWDSSHLTWADQESAVISEIRAAKRKGLRVFAILRVALDHGYPRNRHLWHGQIYPDTSIAVDRWLARYRLFVEKWADIAAREGVDVLALGSEMNALTTTSPGDDPVRRLARWMLDPEAQADYQARLKRHQASIRPRHLTGQGVERPGGFQAWLDDRVAAQQRWSRAVLHLDAPNPDEAQRARKTRLDQAWRQIIAEARARFPGPVGYAANYDQFAAVGFWDALDFVGVNAYFPLRRFSEPPTEKVLRMGWMRALETISVHLEEAGLGTRPVVFTELGLTRRAGSTLTPWAIGGIELLVEGAEDYLYLPQEAPEDFGERARAVRALARVARSHRIRLQGALWWKLTTKDYHRPHEPFALLLGEGDPLEPALRTLGGLRTGAGPRAGESARGSPLRSRGLIQESSSAIR